MNNQGARTALADCNSDIAKIEIIIDKAGATSEISRFLTMHAIIITSGALERCIKTIIADYYEQFSKELAKFICIHIRDNSKNPSLDSIYSMLKSFDPDKNELFKMKLSAIENSEKIKKSLESICNSRNNIAHGRTCNTSFKEACLYFNDAIKIIDCLDKTMA